MSQNIVDKKMAALPQSALIGRLKSLIPQLNFYYPDFKQNKHDLKPIESFFKAIKEDRDWQSFGKLLEIYFIGVLSYAEFFKLYEDKFGKLKQEIREELERQLPTRDQNRRPQSKLLKPMNDPENLQTESFKKIPDSSYYHIEDDYPISYCTAMMEDEVYHKNLN